LRRSVSLPVEARALRLVQPEQLGPPLLIAFVRRGPRESRLQRLASRLFLGTIVEAVATPCGSSSTVAGEPETE